MMAEESIDILSTTFSDDEGMSVDELFSKALETVESCKEMIRKIDEIRDTA